MTAASVALGKKKKERNKRLLRGKKEKNSTSTNQLRHCYARTACPMVIPTDRLVPCAVSRLALTTGGNLLTGRQGSHEPNNAKKPWNAVGRAGERLSGRPVLCGCGGC